MATDKDGKERDAAKRQRELQATLDRIVRLLKRIADAVEINNSIPR